MDVDREVKLQIANLVCGFSDAVHHALVRLYMFGNIDEAEQLIRFVSNLIYGIEYFPDNWIIDLKETCQQLSATIENPDELFDSQWGSWGGALSNRLIETINEIRKLKNK
jgi:hypothetical protein